jgi:hypothetical protein
MRGINQTTWSDHALFSKPGLASWFAILASLLVAPKAERRRMGRAAKLGSFGSITHL